MPWPAQTISPLHLSLGQAPPLFHSLRLVSLLPRISSTPPSLFSLSFPLPLSPPSSFLPLLCPLRFFVSFLCHICRPLGSNQDLFFLFLPVCHSGPAPCSPVLVRYLCTTIAFSSSAHLEVMGKLPPMPSGLRFSTACHVRLFRHPQRLNHVPNPPTCSHLPALETPTLNPLLPGPRWRVDRVRSLLRRNPPSPLRLILR